MLYCNRCGQCLHISDDHFYEIRNVSGTRQVYLNASNGEVEDYGDDDISDDGESTTYCPHCDASHIEFDVDEEEITAEDAFNQRAEYEKGIKEVIRAQKMAQIKASSWDPAENM